MDVRILRLIATVIEFCDPPQQGARGHPPAETIRVLATLRRFLREGTPWRSLTATAAQASGSTLRRDGFEGFRPLSFLAPSHPEGRLFDLVRSALPAGDFIAMPGPSRHLPKLRMTAGCGTLDDQGRSMHRWTTLS